MIEGDKVNLKLQLDKSDVLIIDEVLDDGNVYLMRESTYNSVGKFNISELEYHVETV